MDDFCFCGSGRRKNKCHPHVNPNSVVSSVIKLYSAWDRYLQQQKADQQIKLICAGKCNHCCNNYFYISENEYLTIFCFLKFTYNKRYIISRIYEANQYVLYLKENFPNEYKKIKTIAPTQVNSDIRKYYDDNLQCDQVHPCIFINQKTGLCDIYQARPMICRLHGVANPFTVCNKILNIPNYKQHLVSLDSFPYKEEINWMDFLRGSKTLPNIYRRAYPIAEWFATVLPAQLESNDNILESAYSKNYEEFQRMIYLRHINKIR